MEFNSIDYFVIATLAIFILVGIYRGFIQSIIRMVTSLISVAISLCGYPIACTLARKTFVYSAIKAGIIKHLNIEEMVVESTRQGQSVIIDSLSLPAVFKERLMVNNNEVIYQILDVDNIVDYIGGFLANIALNILMSILIFISSYVIIRIILKVFRLFRKMPVLRTFGRVGGGLSGAVLGVVFIWAIFAVLDAFVTQPFFATVYEDIQQSHFAIYFYNENLIRTFMLGRMF